MRRVSSIFTHLALATVVAIATIATPRHSWAQTKAGPADTAPYFDEVFETLPDGTKRVRPYYADVYKIYSAMTPQQKAAFLKKGRVGFEGDNALDPLPRLIPKSDYEILKKGVSQRGTALRMFLQDYYAGNHRYTSIIPQSVVERIVERNHESGFAGLVPPNQIAFPYGPDIIRNADGGWAVVEDNGGYIGGVGDLKRALDVLMKTQPGYKAALPVEHDPMEFYEAAVATARAHAVPKDGKLVLFMVPPYPDNEDKRIKDLYKRYGVEVVTPRTKNQLKITDDGVFLKSAGANGKTKLERVGYVFLDSEHQWIDHSDPASWEKLVKNEAHAQLEEKTLHAKSRKALEAALVPDPATGKVDLDKLEKIIHRTNIQNDLYSLRNGAGDGLMNAIFKGKVATNYAPGVDFVGDKEFYTYVDDLIRFYLHEEPVVPNIPTQRFAKITEDGKVVVDEELLDKVLSGDNYRKYVIKVVDGRGGDGIFIGPKLKPSDLPAIRAKILANPDSYIVQTYNHLSVVDDRIVDLRLISNVTPDGVQVTATPWGRGVPMSGNGKVNLSSAGREFAVVVVDDKPGKLRIKGCPFAVYSFLQAHKAALEVAGKQ